MIDYDWNLHHENDKNDKLQRELSEAKELIEKLQNQLENESRMRMYYVKKCVQLKMDVSELRLNMDAFGGFLLMIRAPKQVLDEYRKITNDD